MDVERALISKLISTGGVNEAVIKGIEPRHFADEECQEMYVYLLDHVRRYKEPPTKDAIRHDRPKWEFLFPDDALGYLIDRFVQIVKRRFAQEHAVKLAEMADDPALADVIDLKFFEVARDLTRLVPTIQSSKFSDMDLRIDEHERMQAQGTKPGIPFYFRSLDDWTGGIQAHEVVSVSGFSGLGKSTFLIALAFNQWIMGHTVLFISLEMEARSILRRFDAMAAGLDYWKLKHLCLPEVALDTWRAKAREVARKPCDIAVIDSIADCTPQHVIAETMRHQPDIVFIDYLGLMRSMRSTKSMTVWQMIGDITRDLKQSTRELKVPIVAAAQANRSAAKEGAELDNIGQSISIVQDADIVIGLHADEEMKAHKRMQIKLMKNRDGKLGDFMAMWDHDRNLYRDELISERFERKEEEPPPPEPSSNGKSASPLQGIWKPF